MDSNKFKLAALLLGFAVPIVLATWMFNIQREMGVNATSNHGELILPVMDVTELDLRDAEGELIFRTFEEEVADIPADEYQPRPWLLVTLGGPECRARCEERLYYLRQIHSRLAADARRVRRYYLHVGDEGAAPLSPAAQALFEREFPSMGVAHGRRQVLMSSLARTLGPGENPIRDHYTYVVDPVGNVMLYFTPDDTPEDILADIEKLLDQSSLG